jgi:hypothetical protein
MQTRQVNFPFNPPIDKSAGRGTVNSDLIGRSFNDRGTIVEVVGISPSNPEHVLLRQASTGRTWTSPAGIIRLIFGKRRRRKVA